MMDEFEGMDKDAADMFSWKVDSLQERIDQLEDAIREHRMKTKLGYEKDYKLWEVLDT
jgi:hypothetical protein